MCDTDGVRITSQVAIATGFTDARTTAHPDLVCTALAQISKRNVHRTRGRSFQPPRQILTAGEKRGGFKAVDNHAGNRWLLIGQREVEARGLVGFQRSRSGIVPSPASPCCLAPSAPVRVCATPTRHPRLGSAGRPVQSPRALRQRTGEAAHLQWTMAPCPHCYDCGRPFHRYTGQVRRNRRNALRLFDALARA